MADSEQNGNEGPSSGQLDVSEFVLAMASVQRSEAMLTATRTIRPKAPKRRPPTSVARLTSEPSSTQLLQNPEQESLGSSEEESVVERKPRAWEQPKVHWIDELKAVQAKKAASMSAGHVSRSFVHDSMLSSVSSPTVMVSGGSQEDATSSDEATIHAVIEAAVDKDEQTPCHLVVTQVSPQICDLVGATAAIAPSDGTSSTEKPATPTPDKGASTTTTTPDHSGDSKQPAVTDATPAEASSGGRVGVILAVLTLLTLAGAGGFLLLRNPERREYLRSLFRGRNVLVQYSRVRTNEEASLLMHPPGALSDSDDEMLI